MPVETELRVAVEATALLGPRTGVGTMTDALARRLATDPGLALTGVLVSWRGRGRLPAVLPDGVEVEAVPFPARLAHRCWERLDRPRLEGYDVVHGPNFVVPPAPGAAELVTIHDFGPWHTPEWVSVHARRYPRLVDRALGRGAHVHVVSRFVGTEAVDLLDLDPARVHVIPNGYEPSPPGDGSAAQSRIGRPYVLALGSIEPRKDLPTLVAAMARVWDALGSEPVLVVAGADGEGTAAFEAATQRVGAGDRIVRLGYVTAAERDDLLAGAACYAFPSTYEGFGLPPLEAMGQGCPVVTTTAGALPEVCGDAARLVAPGDPEALAAAILDVVTDPTEADRLRAAGRDRVRAFSWDRAATDLAILYHHLAPAP